MATTRNRRAKASPPVEVKPVEAPQAEEVKEAPKPVEEKQVEAPKVKEDKKASKPEQKKVEKPKGLQVGSLVSTPTGKAIVKSLEDNIVVVYKEINKKVSYRFSKEEVKLKG